MERDLSRRDLLRTGAGAALAVGLAGCGVGTGESSGGEEAKKATEKVVKAEPDGDLVYFNWSEYLDPKLMKKFEKQFGVKVRESNFDSMQGMMAKLRSGNRYDVIFPSSEWADRLRKANQLLRIDKGQIPNGDAVYDYFASPWYDPDADRTIPYAMYATRADLPQGQARRPERLVERHGPRGGQGPRLPARRLPGGASPPATW